MSIADRLELVQGDITKQRTDAVVNAANPTLLPGSGVCGAIHRAAGHRLAFECAKLGGCPPGEAKITPGFRLHAKYVIHTVGPVWKDGKQGEPETLARCYDSCLAVAAQHDLQSIAIPSISTGVYGFPIERACPIAVLTVAQGLKKWPGIEKVVLVCYSQAHFQVYEQTLAALLSGEPRQAGMSPKG